ncbi:MAG: hypothetical protein KY396_05515 [Actinobacteria bacterium]|nr:hypothetical protein [Actinomycetota bacterium]
MTQQPNVETPAARAAPSGQDLFASGDLARLIDWHREQRGHEKVRVTVTLRNGETVDVENMLVRKGFLMFLTNDPDEAVFTPASEVVKIHVTKLQEEDRIGFSAEPIPGADEAASP